MVRGAAAVFGTLCALVPVALMSAHAEAGLLVGVHEDQIKWRTRPNPILPAVRILGLDAMRVTSGGDRDAGTRAFAPTTSSGGWQPQTSRRPHRPDRKAPAAAYAALLSRCWDLLHSSVPGVNVITTTAADHDPVAFLGAVADAYRASGRPRPLFDTVGHNPYPLYPDELPGAPSTTYTSVRATTHGS